MVWGRSCGDLVEAFTIVAYVAFVQSHLQVVDALESDAPSLDSEVLVGQIAVE